MLTVYTWGDGTWVEHSDTNSISVDLSTQGHAFFIANTELTAGAVQITISYKDNDIPDDRRFKFCRIDSVEEVKPIIIKIEQPDSLAIPILNEFVYDVVTIDVLAVSVEETEFKAWIKPVPKVVRGGSFQIIC